VNFYLLQLTLVAKLFNRVYKRPLQDDMSLIQQSYGLCKKKNQMDPISIFHGQSYGWKNYTKIPPSYNLVMILLSRLILSERFESCQRCTPSCISKEMEDLTSLIKQKACWRTVEQ